MTTDANAVDIVLERGDKGLGFNIKGGTDVPHLEEDTGIFITKIRDTGAAADDKRLKEGDKIISINDNTLLGVKHAHAVNYFRNSGNSVHLKVIQGEEKKILMQRSQTKPKKDAASHSSSPYTRYIIGISILALSAIVAYRYYIRRA